MSNKHNVFCISTFFAASCSCCEFALAFILLVFECDDILNFVGQFQANSRRTLSIIQISGHKTNLNEKTEIRS